MDVTISSSGMEVSPRLGETTRQKVGKLNRYLSGIDHATVRFSEEKNPRIADPDICEVTLEGHGHHIRSRVNGPTPLAALDRAIHKLERQLRRTKTRRVDRQQHTRERRAS